MAFTWADFFILLLSFTFIMFILNSTNILNLLLIGEIFWIIVFFFGTNLAVAYDALFVFLLSLFILVLATIETSVGLSLLIFKNSTFKSIKKFKNNKEINYSVKKQKSMFWNRQYINKK